mmetsp:Transcript_13602/g.9787  ORF Transcript_13602/g.9787 Transcript_13602/m.9787 type:complete len:84 (+) Transcript_13602:677-928(+)
MFNIGLYFYLQRRKQIRKEEKLHDLMADNNRRAKQIYVDNNMVLENNLSLEDLEIMYSQPEKYRLSNYVRNRVLKEKKRKASE